MNQVVVGLLGVKGAGKDTCAHFLVAERGFVRASFANALYDEVAQAWGTTVAVLGNRRTKETPLAVLSLARCANRDFVEVAAGCLTADRKLRRAAREARDGRFAPHVSRRRLKTMLKAGRSPRWALQLWGTEYRRKSKFGRDAYWLDIVRALIVGNPRQSFVITDVRFHNEADFVEGLGGVLMRVSRPELEALEARNRAANGTAAHSSETELLGRKVWRTLENVEGEPVALRQATLAAFDQLTRQAA